MIDKEVKKCKLSIIFLLISMIYTSGGAAYGIATGRTLSIIIGAICTIICAVCVYRMVLIIELYAKMSDDEKRLIEEYKKAGMKKTE